MPDHAPPFTIGVEEEYLLVDVRHARGRERSAARVVRGPARSHRGSRVSGVPALADRSGHAGVSHDRRGAHVVARPAPGGGRGVGPVRARADRRGEPSVLAVVDAEAHRQGALRRAARGNAGRGAAHDDLRPARARRHRRRRTAHRPDEPGAVLPAAPAGAFVQLAVLGRGAHGPDVVPPDDLQRHSAHRAARAVCELERVPAPHRHADRDRHPRRHLAHLVGPAAERALSHARDARDGLVHVARGLGAARGAQPVPDAQALSAAARQPAVAPVPATADRREPLARDAVFVRRGPARPRPPAHRAVRGAGGGNHRAAARGRDSNSVACRRSRGCARSWSAAPARIGSCRIFEAALQAGADEREAFDAVVDWLVVETAR